jgi:pSer/pThr/pTyr-binding forkhead associated (FHA) protein
MIDDQTDPMGLTPLKLKEQQSEQSADVGATVVGGGGDGEATVVSARAAPPKPRARLRVVHQGAEREVVVEQGETIIGRDPNNPIAIRDPMASRQHAKITLENGEFWIEDMKSLNGTRVNGEIITRHKLASNDQIKVADAVITFTAEMS